MDGEECAEYILYGRGGGIFRDILCQFRVFSERSDKTWFYLLAAI